MPVSVSPSAWPPLAVRAYDHRHTDVRRAIAHRVDAGAAVQRIGAGPALKKIVAITAVEGVVAGAVPQVVLAGAAVEGVIAPLAAEQVAAGPAVQHIRGVVADDVVAVVGPGQVLDVRQRVARGDAADGATRQVDRDPGG